MTNLSRAAHRALHLLLLAAAAVFFVLHYPHLTADFPNHSPWMDWSKYTDEGWYGDAAIRHVLRGRWYVPGDFNPAAALPVWPFLEALVFAVTGVSLAAARALTVTVFGGILVASWFLVSRRPGQTRQHASLAASAAVLLLAASPFCYVFTRMAITEPLLVLLMLLALLVAEQIRLPHPSETEVESLRWARAVKRNLPPILIVGILIPLLILTKTTALFLTPAIFWLIFASARFRIRPFVRLAVPVVLLAVALWSFYFFVLIRPHLLADYRYLFSANAYTGMTRQNFIAVLASTVKDSEWMGSILAPLGFAAIAVAFGQGRRLLEHPLLVALLLWIFGYMTFLAYHNNLQPRYYLVVVVPLTLLLVATVEDLIVARLRSALARNVAFAVVGVGLAGMVIPDAAETLHFVRTPEYTLVQAAQSVANYIRHDQQSDPAHNPLILSISGSDITLITHIPSICDDFGTMELVDRVKKYKPGWYVAWNQVEDDKMDAIWPLFALERVAAYPAMDDPDRNLLVLYKLVPAGSVPQRPTRKAEPIPRRLRTRIGQQPSTEQLEH